MPVFTQEMLNNTRLPIGTFLDDYVGWHYCSDHYYSFDKADWCRNSIGEYRKEWVAFNRMFLFKHETSATMFLLRFSSNEDDGGFIYAPYVPINRKDNGAWYDSGNS